MFDSLLSSMKALDRKTPGDSVLQRYHPHPSRKPSRLAVIQASHDVFLRNTLSVSCIYRQARGLREQWVSQLHKLPKDADHNLFRAIQLKIRRCDEISRSLPNV